MAFVAPSMLVWFGIPGLSLLVAAAVAFGFRASAPDGRRGTVFAWALGGIGGYFALSGLLAVTGLLSMAGHAPPPMMVMMAMLSVTTVLVALGPHGARFAESLPLWVLVGLQAFRLPLELVLWRAAEDGTMPVEMSFEGRNFDVVTGTTAIVLAIVLYRRTISASWVLAWNIVGTVLLANIVSVAIAALPWIHAFGTARVNEWVLHVPFVWLPAILVQAALFGHVIVFRRLRAEAAKRTAARNLGSYAT